MRKLTLRYPLATLITAAVVVPGSNCWTRPRPWRGNRPSPDQGQVKQPDNYVGRILATIVTFGITMFWWFHNQMDEPNKHFTSNWAQEDTLVNAVDVLS